MKHVPWSVNPITADPLVWSFDGVVILTGADLDYAEIGAAITPMQAANNLAGKLLFSWRILRSIPEDRLDFDAADVHCLKNVGQVHRDVLIVIAGQEALQLEDKGSIGWVRRQFRAGSRFVLFDNAQISMARAGLLDDRTIAVHWEKIHVFREAFPSVLAMDQLYTLDPVFSASTCSDATIELFLSLIDQKCGSAFVRSLRERLNRPHCRPPQAPQSVPLSQRYGTRDQTFLEILHTIEESSGEGHCVNDLCQQFGMSRRHLERKFSAFTGMTPNKFIKDCKLRKAIQLLQFSDMQDIDVAIACGFSSLTNFRTLFKRKYGLTPSQFTQTEKENACISCQS